MRVISGQYGGRYLKNFKADFIRPTTDRVKESLFNILGDAVENANIYDLFSGTGNLGIEALSRGCAEVNFVELRDQALQIIKENLTELKIESGYRIHKKDVFRLLKSHTGAPADIIFADPPFTETWAHELAQAFSRSKLVGEQTLICMETTKREKCEDLYGNLAKIDTRNFGDKNLVFFKRKLNETDVETK